MSTVTCVYAYRIRSHTAVYDRRLSPFISVNGVSNITFPNLCIFSRRSYMEYVSCRSAPYTTVVHGDRERSPFISVNGRLRPCLFDLEISLTCYLVILQIYGVVASLSYHDEIRHSYEELPFK